jgi:hypothetical protein
MTPLDVTQECPVFSRIRPGVYVHAPMTVCDYCECTVPECPMCGGMGPYRPLINVKWLAPFSPPPSLRKLTPSRR